MEQPMRRRLLGVLGSGLTALAGCGESPAGDDGDEDRDGSTTDTEAPTARETDTRSDSSVASDGGSDTGTSTPDLDLREANVVEVAIESAGDDQYRFDVTLYHDDDGEDGYANWWQVETLDGEQLGRRELLHAHSTAPFTRSETIAVPDGVSCVVVRGHDQTHGYGGQAMVVGIPSGETNPVQQGSERQAISADACP